MANYKHTIPYGVIGLGRFGTALAETLAKSGVEVLVLDSNEEKIRDIQGIVDHAFVVPHMTKAALEETGIQNCNTVIVCIGETIEVSILVTLNVIDLGVGRVISKAISTDHGKVLNRIGAEVVFPERDRAVRLAKTLVSSKVIDYLEISDEFEISEIKVSNKLQGRTLYDLDFRKKYKLNVIAIIKGDETIVEFLPDTILEEGDMVVVVGRKDSIQQFAKILWGK